MLWASSNNHEKNFKYKWNKEWKKSSCILQDEKVVLFIFFVVVVFLGEQCGSTPPVFTRIYSTKESTALSQWSES